MNKTIHCAAVLGAGVMGCGIAALLSATGIRVMLLDVVPKELTQEELKEGLTQDSPQFRNRLAQAGLDRIENPRSGMLYDKNQLGNITIGNMSDHMNLLGQCDWIIEVVVERLDVKRSVMEQIIAHRKPGSIVSTNTSGVSIRQIAGGFPEEFRQHFMGTHFFNPVRYMKLFELIPTEDTLPELMSFMKDFATHELGKGVVFAKDTPSFIGNRIGVFANIDAMRLTEQYGYNLPTADLLTGPVIGRPKSATFKTADIVGLDILGNVARNVRENVSDEAEHAAYQLPGYVATLIERGALGDKVKHGFYKKEIVNGKRVPLAFDRANGDYAMLSAEAMPCVTEALRSPSKYRSIVSGDSKEQLFIWALLSDLLLYSAKLVPEITEDYTMIDKAMRWGYNWEKGPFEIWDALGVSETIQRIRAEGRKIPDWVSQRLASGKDTFYSSEEQSSGYLNLGSATIACVAENKGASLRDLGDGVLCLELHTKGNSIGESVLDMIEEATRQLHSEKWVGLVIGNQGGNFSAGADLNLIYDDAKNGKIDSLRAKITRLQDAMLGLKYAPRPVVAAVFGTALGGGAEMAMHAAGVVAHVETYMGQVEAGVGMVPAGGGCKELLVRAMERCTGAPKTARLLALKEIWRMIATGAVTTSAFDAINQGFLRQDTQVIMNQDELLDAAKRRVQELVARGYHPPVAPEVVALGDSGFSAIQYDIQAMIDGGFISAHDALVATRTAYILAGGGVPADVLVTEADLLALERDEFSRLAADPKTQDRINAMLTTGKMLKN